MHKVKCQALQELEEDFTVAPPPLLPVALAHALR